MINKRKFINKRRLTLISTSIDTSWSPLKQMTQCFRHCCVLCEKIKNKGYSNGDSVEAKCIHGILKYNHCSLELINITSFTEKRILYPPPHLSLAARCKDALRFHHINHK